MLDHPFRCIFIHTRKAAGSSIISAFGYQPRTPEWNRYNDGVLGADWDKRPEDLRGYFVFSAVRNPFDRLISGWQYIKTLRALPLAAVLENPPQTGHPFRHLTRPQAALIRDRTGHLVTDDLVRYESCQQDFDRICRRIGKPQMPLPQMTVNVRRTRDWRACYDGHTRKLATALFAEDLETFGYSFDGPG